VILLSFVLVVVSATALGFGVFQSSDPLVWTSLVAGLGAVALIVGSILRRRRELVPGAVPDAAGPVTAGSVTVGSASAGGAPATSPTPTRSGSTAVPSTTDPVSPPGPWAGAPDRTWPWATTPPGGTPDTGSRSGWTGPVPDVRPPADRPAEGSSSQPADRPATQPAASADGQSAAHPGGSADRQPAARPSVSADWPRADQPSGGSAEPPPASPPYADAPAGSTLHTGPDASADAGAAWDAAADGSGADGEPGIERVTVRDALRVAQLSDEVVVVDGHPRYHLASCPTLSDAETTPLAVSVARRGGFTPCAVCGPDGTFLARLRGRTGDGPSAD
jgi:hypothetical protein